MLQFEINKTIAESYNPRNERLYIIMYYGMVLTLPHAVDELSKEKNNKETQNVEVFLCPFSSNIKCYHSSWSRTEVHAHCTIQWMRWLIFNWLLNIWTVDNVFPMCSLSLSFSLSISFCLFSVSGSVLYSEKFPSILHHSSAEASIFLLGGWKMLLSLVHMQSSVYCVYKIYSNSWKFPSVLPYLFYFLRVAKLIYEFKFCYKTLTKMERSFKWSLHLCKSMCMYFVIQNSILGKYVDAMVVPCAKFKLIEKIESKS